MPSAQPALARSIIKYGLHPGLLIGALALWFALDRGEIVFILVLVGAHLIMAVCEIRFPAKPEWKQRGIDKLQILGLTLLDFIVFGLVVVLYELTMAPPLVEFREWAGLNLWPTEWPLIAQVFMVYFTSEFIYYWIHRGIHTSGFLWRFSGHGVHHSFQNLHAINFLTSHPMEILFLALPSVFLGALFGVGTEPLLGASIILAVNAGIAHSNIVGNSRVIGWLFTTAEQHRRHHSTVFADSNSNYSCNAIIWDRLFGTYSEGPVEQTGIGPEEPGFWDKMMLPLREPDSTTVAPDPSKADNQAA